MIREFPAENRAEVVMPRCSVCKQYMKRAGVKGRVGANPDTRRRKDGQLVLDALTVDSNVTLTQMAFQCKKNHEHWIMPMSEVLTLNCYTPRNITIVDLEGNEL